MSQIIDHAQQLIAILFAVHALAVLIVNVTPTPKDDAVVSKFYKIIEVLAGIVTKLAKR